MNNISKLCYELYKIDWKQAHNITKEREMEYFKDYYRNLIGEDTEYTYNDYLEEFGYNGELYVCYEEFLEAEYQKDDYICTLLDDYDLIEMYREDVKQQFLIT